VRILPDKKPPCPGSVALNGARLPSYQLEPGQIGACLPGVLK